MGRTVYRTAMALTGHIADEHQSLDWLLAVEGGEATRFEEFLATVSVLVQGSTTYEWVLRQEHLLQQPDKWPVLYGDRPMYVFTHRELAVPAGADVRFVRGPVADALPSMRVAAGDRVLWVVGGGELAGQFVDVDALDEVVLTVAPVALPAGAPVLPRRLDASRLQLANVQRQGQFVELTYQLRPAAAQSPGLSDAGAPERGVAPVGEARSQRDTAANRPSLRQVPQAVRVPTRPAHPIAGQRRLREQPVPGRMVVDGSDFT